MFAIAWADTPEGRLSVILRSVTLLLIGVIFYAAGRLVWEPVLLWLGRALLLFGVFGAAWACFHKSRGLPPLQSAACASNRHIECELTAGEARCDCRCHPFRRERPRSPAERVTNPS